jgi:invasion protein IalB
MREVMMKKSLAVALILCGLVPSLAHAATKPIYQARHGGWSVQCSQDVMSDAKSCSAVLRTTGRGVLGESTMTVVVFSADRTKPPTIVIHVPLLILQQGLTMRLDSAPPVDTRCTTVSGDQCLIQGADRDRLLAGWPDAKQLVVRAYGVGMRPYDFVFDLDGSGAALDDFTGATNRLL